MLNMQRSNTDIKHTVCVVIADHDETDRNTVLDLLSAEDGFMVEGVSSFDGLMALLAVRDVDCIIVDKVLGSETGFLINDRVTAKYLDPPAMIMLTGTGDERVAMKAFRCGFSNYVRKQSLDSRELITAILARDQAKRRAHPYRRGEMHARMSTGNDQDQRKIRRIRTLKGARIDFNGGYSAYECTVRDLTPNGARLEFGDATGVPNHFWIDLEHGHEPRRKCTMRWRAGLTVGVSFDDAE